MASWADEASGETSVDQENFKAERIISQTPDGREKVRRRGARVFSALRAARARVRARARARSRHGGGLCVSVLRSGTRHGSSRGVRWRRVCVSWHRCACADPR